MKSTSCQRLIKMICKKWWIFIPSVLIFCTFFLYMGHETLQTEEAGYGKAETDGTDVTQSAEYQETLQYYDNSIAERQESIMLTEQQIEEQKSYCDNSIYMRLDSRKYYVASIVYSVQGAISEADSVNILNAIAYRVNVNHLGPAVEQHESDISSQYLSEIVSCSVTGNTLYITISYFDESGAIAIREIVEQELQQQIKKISSVYGNFELVKIDEDIYEKADINILNNQNTARNTLKNYQGNLADLQKSIADLQASKQQYIENTITAAEADSAQVKSTTPKLVMIRFGVVGLLVGVMLPIMCFSIIFIVDDRIKNVADLNRFGLLSYGVLTDSSTVSNINALLGKQDISKIFFNIIDKNIANEKLVDDLEKVLEPLDIQYSVGQISHETGKKVKHFVSTDGCILVIKLKDTTATQLQEQLQICQRLEIPVLGCVQF